MDILVYSGLELLGDGVIKLPFLRALRLAWPQAHITWLAGKGATVFADTLAPIVRTSIDEVIQGAGIGMTAGELLRRPLPGRRFDLVIDTQRRVLTTLILRRIAADRFVSGAADFLLSDARPPRPYRKPPSMLGQLLDLVWVASGSRPAPDFSLPLDDSWTTAAQALLPPGPLYVGIAPGAGGVHKRWPLERFLALAETQRASGRAPVFLLGPAEAAMRSPIEATMPSALLPLQQAEATPSPLLTIALGRRLAVAIANDSGIGHLLAASGCPLVSLFGPTRAAKFAPYARRLELVDANGFGAPEMEAIPLAAVAEAVERQLSGCPPPPRSGCPGRLTEIA